MPTEAPYRRIVTELRRRIDAGELRPGDPVPSTRRIVRDYGVAMATATKVIAALRDEGLVVTRPGAGTVVRTGPAPAARPRDRELSRHRVVRAGIAIADTEGLAALTMRRVATDLGVATMALYRHVRGKDELVLLMTDAVFAGHPLPAAPPPGWRDRLATAARLMWTVFRRHPWAAEAMSMTRPQLLPHLVPYAEWSLGALRGLGLGAADMMHAHLTLVGHVRGAALNLVAERQAEQDTGMTNEEWLDARGELARLLSSGRYPALAYVAGQGFDYDLDALVEYGLERILDGIAARLR